MMKFLISFFCDSYRIYVYHFVIDSNMILFIVIVNNMYTIKTIVLYIFF